MRILQLPFDDPTFELSDGCWVSMWTRLRSSSVLHSVKICDLNGRMILAARLNSDLATYITEMSAVMTVQSYARRRLARREAMRRRSSGEYAFHEMLCGTWLRCWMTHEATIAYIQRAAERGEL